jgi:hypothetical protein
VARRHTWSALPPFTARAAVRRTEMARTLPRGASAAASGNERKNGEQVFERLRSDLRSYLSD